MPRTLTWSKSIDAVELTANADSRPLGAPRSWRIHTKAGGGILGCVIWMSNRREYAFLPTGQPMPSIRPCELMDIGSLCFNHTELMKAEKRKAAG